jgi:hypothetical protein
VTPCRPRTDPPAVAARRACPIAHRADHGRVVTSTAFTSVLQRTGVRISMDGRGRWLDNVFHRAAVAIAEVQRRSTSRAMPTAASPSGARRPSSDDRVAGGDDGPPARERRGHDAPACGSELGRRLGVAHMPTAATAADLRCSLKQNTRTALVQLNRALPWSSRQGPHLTAMALQAVRLDRGAHTRTNRRAPRVDQRQFRQLARAPIPIP